MKPAANNSATEHTWIRLSTTHPAALQARLYTAESYYRLLYRKPLNPTTNLLTIYAEAIKLLNGALRDPEAACSDGIILAVGGLAFYANYTTDNKPASSSSLPAQGPLKDLHGLHIYSHMSFDSVHRNGMESLIKLRGGLERFSTPGFAPVAS
jgi:hypothetical protein